MISQVPDLSLPPGYRTLSAPEAGYDDQVGMKLDIQGSGMKWMKSTSKNWHIFFAILLLLQKGIKG